MAGSRKKPAPLNLGLVEKVASKVFADTAERAAFQEALLAGESKELSLIVLQDQPAIQTFPRLKRTAWQPEFIERIQEGFKPGNHPLYAKGAFYSMDFSSVFAATPLVEVARAGKVRRILDLCSAPGGKGIFAHRCFRTEEPPLLIANEVIRKRTGILRDNLKRCHIAPAMVTSWDPQNWAKFYPEAFDLVLVDAPCSGQSLIAKGDAADGAFHPKMISMNASRQRRILANGIQALRPGGHLLYMTCTYSPEENERVIEWARQRFPEIEPVAVPDLVEFASGLADFPAYRLFPQMGLGAGAFSCLLRKQGEPDAHWPSLERLKPLWQDTMDAV